MFSKNRKLPPPKDKSRITLLLDKLTEEEAFEWETFFIKAYGRIDNETGILRNLTDGGEGMSGYTHSESSKYKIEENNKRTCRWMVKCPNGNIEIIKSLEKFCNEKGLDSASLSRTLTGRCKTHKGFSAIKFDESKTADENKMSLLSIVEKRSDYGLAKKYEVTFPNGVKKKITNLRNFCRNNELTFSSMWRIAKGLRKTHKGYSINEFDNRTD